VVGRFRFSSGELILGCAVSSGELISDSSASSGELILGCAVSSGELITVYFQMEDGMPAVMHNGISITAPDFWRSPIPEPEVDIHVARRTRVFSSGELILGCGVSSGELISECAASSGELILGCAVSSGELITVYFQMEDGMPRVMHSGISITAQDFWRSPIPEPEVDIHVARRTRVRPGRLAEGEIEMRSP
jgi:hypothetical protein